jgi:hypothetical protein
MLSLRFVVLALAAVAEAGKLYGCAGTCIGKAITATGCSSSNSQCICSSVMFMETIKDCASECTEAQTESALTVAEEFCNLIGDDLPQLTHEKRGGRPHGGYRGGHGHPRPAWAANGAWGGEAVPAASPAPSPAPAAPQPEFPNWSAEGGRVGQGGGGRFGGRPGHGAPPPVATYTPSVSTPVQPAHTQGPPPKHPQPPAPAHSHSGTSTTSTAKPTWTTPSGPEHTVW